MAETEADKHIFVNNFKVNMGFDAVHITKVSPITLRIPKVAATSGLDTAQRTYRPGRPNFGNITFEGAEEKGQKDVQNWFKSAYDGSDVRKDVTVEICNQAGDTVRTFNLFCCLPVYYSSIDFSSQGGNQTMHFVIEVNVQRIEMK